MFGARPRLSMPFPFFSANQVLVSGIPPIIILVDLFVSAWPCFQPRGRLAVGGCRSNPVAWLFPMIHDISYISIDAPSTNRNGKRSLYIDLIFQRFFGKKQENSLIHLTCQSHLIPLVPGEGLPFAASLRRPADPRCRQRGALRSAACGPAPGPLRGAGGGAGEEGGERKESGGAVVGGRCPGKI